MIALAVVAILAATASKFVFPPQIVPLDVVGGHSGTYIQGSVSYTHLTLPTRG